MKEGALAMPEIGPENPSGKRVSGNPGIDGHTLKLLKSGKIRPEARLDLHGMRAEEAREAFISFIRRTHAEGRKLLLVITGKGKGEEGGVLRQALPRWLAEKEMAALTQGHAYASREHGGEGAFYVALRRS